MDLGDDRSFGNGRTEVLAGVDQARALGARALPGEVTSQAAGPGLLQRQSDGGGTGLADPDVGRAQSVGRSSDGDEGALVGEELDDPTRADEGDAIGAPVLDPRLREGRNTEPVVLVRDRSGQVDGGVGGAVAAVVEDDRPAGEVGAGRTCDLDELAGVGADVVIVQLVDEDRRVRRGHRPCRRREQGPGRHRQRGDDGEEEESEPTAHGGSPGWWQTCCEVDGQTVVRQPVSVSQREKNPATVDPARHPSAGNGHGTSATWEKKKETVPSAKGTVSSEGLRRPIGGLSRRTLASNPPADERPCGEERRCLQRLFGEYRPNRTSSAEMSCSTWSMVNNRWQAPDLLCVAPC